MYIKKYLDMPIKMSTLKSMKLFLWEKNLKYLIIEKGDLNFFCNILFILLEAKHNC